MLQMHLVVHSSPTAGEISCRSIASLTSAGRVVIRQPRPRCEQLQAHLRKALSRLPQTRGISCCPQLCCKNLRIPPNKRCKTCFMMLRQHHCTTQRFNLRCPPRLRSLLAPTETHRDLKRLSKWTPFQNDRGVEAAFIWCTSTDAETGSRRASVAEKCQLMNSEQLNNKHGRSSDGCLVMNSMPIRPCMLDKFDSDNKVRGRPPLDLRILLPLLRLRFRMHRSSCPASIRSLRHCQ